jgi:hypothetical protein
LRHEVEKVSIGTPVVYGLVGPKALDKVNILYCAKFFEYFYRFPSLKSAFTPIKELSTIMLKGKWVPIPTPIIFFLIELNCLQFFYHFFFWVKKLGDLNSQFLSAEF